MSLFKNLFKESENVRAHLQDERQTTNEDSEARNGWRRSTSWETSKLARWHNGSVRLFTAEDFQLANGVDSRSQNHSSKPTFKTFL